MNFWSIDRKQWSQLFLRFRSDALAMLLLICCISIVLASFFQNALLVSDDYEHHVVRTANYVLALRQGQLPPRWAPNANGGYGYPAFLYTYPLPYMLAAAFHLVGLSMQLSVNMVVVLSAVTASLTAYLYARWRKCGVMVSGLIAVAYVCNPYTLLSMFWRGALGELVFYALAPLIVLLVEVLLERQKTQYRSVLQLILALSVSAAILSHLLSFVLLSLYLVLHTAAMYGQKKLHRDQLLRLLSASLVGVALAAWYWLPAVLEKSLVRFDSVSTQLLATGQFVSLGELLQVWRTARSSQYFTEVIQLGLLPITAFLLALTQLWHARSSVQQMKKHAVAALALGTSLVVILSMTTSGEWVWSDIPFLSMQQFPWRILWLVVLLSLIIWTRYATQLPKILVVGLLVLASCSAVYGYVQVKGTSTRSDYEWYESVATGSSFDEFRPRGARPAAAYGLEREVLVVDQMQEVSGAEVVIQERTGTRMQYRVITSEPATVVQKTIDFPGWEVLVDGQRVSKNTEPVLPERAGLLQFSVPAGEHTVVTSFSGTTPVRQLGGLITLFGSGVGLYWVWLFLRSSGKLRELSKL